MSKVHRQTAQRIQKSISFFKGRSNPGPINSVKIMYQLISFSLNYVRANKLSTTRFGLRYFKNKSQLYFVELSFVGITIYSGYFGFHMNVNTIFTLYLHHIFFFTKLSTLVVKFLWGDGVENGCNEALFGTKCKLWGV